MPICYQSECAGARFAVWHITETEEDLFSKLDDKRYHALQLKQRLHPRRRIDYLTTRLLLQVLLPQAATQVTYLPNGRPVLPDKLGFLSLSHTAGYAAVIVHPFHPVAIDIEQQGSKAARLATRFVRADEQQCIAATQKKEVCTFVWSAKESLFKIIQEEAVDFKEHLYLFLETPLPTLGSVRACVHKNLCVREYYIFYQLQPHYVLTYIIEQF